jgi:hypothetical protein
LLILLIKNWLNDPFVGLGDVERFEELEDRLLNVLACELFGAIECHIEELPRRLGELYFWILDIHLHTPHIIEFFLAWHFFLLFCPCKQILT